MGVGRRFDDRGKENVVMLYIYSLKISIIYLKLSTLYKLSVTINYEIDCRQHYVFFNYTVIVAMGWDYVCETRPLTGPLSIS
jgi:hypothetical protein